jgi:hypothetical protein
MKASIILLVSGSLLCAVARADGQGSPDGAPDEVDALLGAEPAEPSRTVGPGYPCGVHLLRAPRELAVGIEARIKALSACGRRLDVWIVRAQDGLYVIAKDEQGRMRERVVPDSEVAAALIASWVEVDAATPLTGAGMIAPARTDAGAADAEPLPPLGERASPPGDTDARGATTATSESAPRVGRTVGLSAFAGVTREDMTTGGAMVDVDVFHHEGLSIAAMGMVMRDIASSYYVVNWEDDFFKETGRWGGAALVELHHRVGTGRFRFTPSLAFGLGITGHEVLSAPEAAPGVIAEPVMTTEMTYGPRIVVNAAFGVHVTSSLDVELNGGWMFSGYQGSDKGIESSDHAFFAGIGLRHDR